MNFSVILVKKKKTLQGLQVILIRIFCKSVTCWYIFVLLGKL